jgi:hypothetical protein
MRYARSTYATLVLSCFTALAIALPEAQAQQRPLPPGPGGAAPQRGPQGAPPAAPQAAPVKPYKAVPVTLAAPVNDPSFEAFRKQLADIASKKDRAGLGRVVANGFFWMGEKGDKANKRKSGLENLVAAMELDAQDGSGWENISHAAGEATLEPVPNRKGVMCGPAGPGFDERAAEQVAKDTGTDQGDWGFINRAGVQVHAAAQPNAPVIDTVGMVLIRVMEEEPAAGAQPSPFVKVVTPSGKVGFVAEDVIGTLDVQQVCYQKDASGWKIVGIAGGE